MPFYDLRCTDCDTEHNISASISDKILKQIACPECGSIELVSVYKSAPAYIKSMKSVDCPNSHVCGAGCRHAG